MSEALDQLKKLVDTMTPDEQLQVFRYTLKQLESSPPLDEASIAELERLKAIDKTLTAKAGF